MWLEGDTVFISIPFTWELPIIREYLLQRNMHWNKAIVGGPAVKLMPEYLTGMDWVTVGTDMPGVLQRVNPSATKTTTGCIRKCAFCGVPKFEGELVELGDWPDLPIICDNNLLAASGSHFDRVMDRLEVHGWADFNQGIDSRLLTDHHAERFSRIRPMIRFALDNMTYADQWEDSFTMLKRHKIPNSCIRSYAIIGFDSGVDEAWKRCKWIESHGIKVLPMWFHSLHALKKNQVTRKQKELGWNDYERRRIMQWFYKHKEAVAA